MSWDTAYETLQTALALASSGDEIWVAAGTYYPDDGSTLLPPPDDPRAIAFLVRSDIDIYGGFPASGDPGWGDRDWETHVTILSGDIDENDSANPVTDPATQIVGKNAYHVVLALSTAELNGFTITAGEAEGDKAYARGGGMYNSVGATTELRNVTFSGNAANFGGGLYNEQSSPTLNNVTFEGNQASASGGGMANNQSSDPTLTNVTFTGNKAPHGYGGGMVSVSSNPTLTNVTFEGNRADYGGGMQNYNSNPTLTNVTFEGNQAYYGGGMQNFESSSPTLTNVTFSGNNATLYGGGMYNSSSSPTIQNSIIWGNTAGGGDQIFNADFSDTGSNPDISYTLVEGGITGSGIVNGTNSSVTDSGNNLDSDPLFIAPVATNKAPIRMKLSSSGASESSFWHHACIQTAADVPENEDLHAYHSGERPDHARGADERSKTGRSH
jgi:hypothetical protein